MTATRTPAGRAPLPRRGNWIPWAFVGFFGVVFAANGLMLFFALDSFTGLSTPDAYRQGVEYNQRIEQARRQQTLGWSVDFSAEPQPDRRLQLDLDIQDSYGAPIGRALVTARISRPTHGGHDLTVPMLHQIDGHYEAAIDLPLHGQWDIEITTDSDQGTYRLRERVLVP